ncbi:thioredoxin family protein [Sedimenticola hydrogenitrophicus]|uniref:thioredoxin family protein n=1 Tax=Sedimenticola hydrogenitrophicus TaxID=2967975 RepID=UPI0021A7AEC5|nr:thioredoxin family protein [Sedimenticola hydrogenitrophicus]
MTEERHNSQAPEALMLIGTHCTHCPAVLNSLAELVKQGVLSKLEVINLEQRPEVVQQLGVRSVPWMRIGPFELTGQRSLAELRQWAQTSASADGIRDYIEAMLAEGEMERVLAMIAKDAGVMARVIELLDDADARINVRLGIGVIMEEYQGQPLLQEYIPQIGELTRHADPRVRGDACHYLALSHSRDARIFIAPLLNDENADVREVAGESLLALDD